MCGFAGFLTPSGEHSREMERTVIAMSDAVRHRGPEDSGNWVDPENGVAFGHRRLSILDLSPEGHQPMHSSCGRYVITYNGEVYDFAVLKKELDGKGHHFRGRSDTEVMLACFTEWGVEASLSKFGGMFAFAVWDKKEKALYLARDRLGKKPLYYGWLNGYLFFGSELKALVRHPLFRPEIDRDALGSYLHNNYIPAPRTIYRGIYQLQAGSFLRVPRETRDHPSPQRFWSLKEVVAKGMANPFQGSEEDAVSKLQDLLKDSVKSRMVADVPLGAFLSGGIDSSLVVALMQMQSNQPVKTFTIGYDSGDSFNEAELAKKVAKHLGTDHTELYVTSKEAIDVIPKLPALYDEPFSDASQIPTFLLAQLARKHVTVALSGDGGDELFAGYERYLLGQKLDTIHRWVPDRVTDLSVASLGMLRDERFSKLSRLLSEKDSKKLYSLFASNPAVPDDVVLDSDATDILPLGGGEKLDALDLADSFMYLDTLRYIPDDIFVKVDRATMGVSLEARAPILDYRIVEFAWRLPMRMKIRDGQGKWILRKILHQYVPKEMVERPKVGFGAPVGTWIRGPLRDWAESLLDLRSLRNAGYFDPLLVREKWREFLGGKTNRQSFIWAVLMFQAWYQENSKSLAHVPRSRELIVGHV